MIFDGIWHLCSWIWILTSLNAVVCQVSFDEQSSCPRKSHVPFMIFEPPKDSSQATRSTSHMKSAKRKEMSNSKALAVVLYKEENLLPHEKKHRIFHIGGHEYQIKQDWGAGGVAAVVWDAAVVLGDYLAANVHLVKNKHVLELGAGTGLAGMVASSLGADVIVTERKESLTYLETAISKNQEGKDWKIRAEVLDWTEPVHTDTWGHFDIIIGADIIYIESTFPHLLRTLKSLAPTLQTQILLSCRIRYDRDIKFLHKLKKFFEVEEIFYNSKLDIKIFSAVSKS